ncbi:mandelate racemase/muconate lactonizing enzyme family protein [Umezawaea sp. NPDC059074]|uniref:mandelate racemase/muconate lactonizing enzyme family protein n=1 Tax=Umezawaea sp. NPDC059074 TaxID=3346716 RepID=UPI003680B14B
MRITSIETVVPDLPLGRPFTFVRLHTDEGLVGLGQTVDLRTVDVIHDLGRRFLLGADPRRVTALWHRMVDWVAYHGYAGAEIRAISAFDIACWDLVGQAAGLPVVALLGGAVHDSVPIYNTCGNYGGVSDDDRVVADPVGLAEELLAQGVTCLKWSPFDRYAEESHGQYLTTMQLAEGVSGIEKIASALGGRVEVMIDAHGAWSPGCAAQIVRALDGLPVRWLEDPVSSDNPVEWARLRAKSTVPIAGGERLLTRNQLRGLLDVGGVDVLISDVTWSGGITEARRTADLADLHGVPLATHGNSGPVTLWSSAHVLTSVRNAGPAETHRVHHDPVSGYFHTLVDGEPVVVDGRLRAPTAPGLGIALRDDFPVLHRREQESGNPAL